MDQTLALLRWGDAGWADEMARGLAMTLAVASCAFVLALAFGTISAAAKLSGWRAARLAAGAYTTVVRGIPELLIIYLFFFGGSLAATAVARVFGYGGFFELDAFTIGVVAVGLVSGAYAGEVIRGGFEAVPRGEVEAARACGMSRFLLLRRIMIPQALRFALPGLGNVWQVTLKETALISVVGLVEIMRQASIASGSTQQPFTFYFVAAILYLGLALVSGRGFRAAEAWSSRGVRRT